MNGCVWYKSMERVDMHRLMFFFVLLWEVKSTTGCTFLKSSFGEKLASQQSTGHNLGVSLSRTQRLLVTGAAGMQPYLYFLMPFSCSIGPFFWLLLSNTSASLKLASDNPSYDSSDSRPVADNTWHRARFLDVVILASLFLPDWDLSQNSSMTLNSKLTEVSWFWSHFSIYSNSYLLRVSCFRWQDLSRNELKSPCLFCLRDF